jgi:CDP-glucose 4,6-dehydratase
MINNKFWQNKNVLITGHTGFKGGWLSVWMNILGAKVSGYSINPLTKKNFFNSAKIKKIFFKDYRKNIQNYKNLEECIKKTKPQIIFHLAAQSQVLVSFKNPLDTILTNVVGTSNLLQIVKKYKFIKSVVIVTTDKVYKNNEKKIKFSENDHLGGDDLYSSSKACADIISSSYFNSFFIKSSCGIATARAGNCIGGGDWTRFRILTDATEAFLQNKKLKIRNPNSTRPWQHVLEPLLGYILLAEKLFGNKQKKYCTSWNFGPSRRTNVKVLKFAKTLRSKMRSKSELILSKRVDNIEKKNLDLDSKKANKILGWKSFLSIDDTLKLTSDWYLANYQKKNMYNFTCTQIKDFLNIYNDL